MAPAATVPEARRVRRVAPWMGGEVEVSGFFPRDVDIPPV
jgi:hypothetical protein